jgi:hypothetical protein
VSEHSRKRLSVMLSTRDDESTRHSARVPTAHDSGLAKLSRGAAELVQHVDAAVVVHDPGSAVGRDGHLHGGAQELIPARVKGAIEPAGLNALPFHVKILPLKLTTQGVLIPEKPGEVSRAILTAPPPT